MFLLVFYRCLKTQGIANWQIINLLLFEPVYDTKIMNNIRLCGLQKKMKARQQSLLAATLLKWCVDNLAHKRSEGIGRFSFTP